MHDIAEHHQENKTNATAAASSLVHNKSNASNATKTAAFI